VYVKKFKIADPRFVTPEEIDRIIEYKKEGIDFEEWTVPPDAIRAAYPYGCLELGGDSKGKLRRII